MAPLYVNAREAARMIGVSLAMWWKMKNSGRCPGPVRIGRKALWYVAEILEWAAEGCPPVNGLKALQYRQQRRDALRTLPKAIKQ